jgi:hypothetical protein
MWKWEGTLIDINVPEHLTKFISPEIIVIISTIFQNNYRHIKYYTKMSSRLSLEFFSLTIAITIQTRDFNPFLESFLKIVNLLHYISLRVRANLNLTCRILG